MSPLASRVVVAVIGLPIVLALVYAGGWWLFALVAVGAVLALHEYALMTRSLRPVTLAAYAGALLALLGAELGGWNGRWRAFSRRSCSRSSSTGSVRHGSRPRSRSRPRCSAPPGSGSVSRTCCCCATAPTTGGSRRSRCCWRSGQETSAPSSRAE